MTYLVFSTLEAAEEANSLIAQNLGCTGNATTAWALIIETVDGKFALQKPEPLTVPLDPVLNEETGEWSYQQEVRDPLIGVNRYTETEEIHVLADKNIA